METTQKKRITPFVGSEEDFAVILSQTGAFSIDEIGLAREKSLCKYKRNKKTTDHDDLLWNENSKKWSCEEEFTLVRMVLDGYNPVAISETMGRPIHTVRQKTMFKFGTSNYTKIADMPLAEKKEIYEQELKIFEKQNRIEIVAFLRSLHF